MKFSGKRPIPKAVEGELCYIEAPHTHACEPDNAKVLYREHDGYYHFMGDPVAFGYDGPKHTDYGHPPAVIDSSLHLDAGAEPVTEFCYLDGPHFHHDTPSAGMQINIIHQPIVYVRPVIVVAPPAGYLGPILDVHVTVPTVEVHVHHKHEKYKKWK